MKFIIAGLAVVAWMFVLEFWEEIVAFLYDIGMDITGMRWK
jgi:hypothetical protein